MGDQVHSEIAKNPSQNRAEIALNQTFIEFLRIFGTILSQREYLEKSIGGDWFRPDVADASGMSRMSVGLVNHPTTLLIGNSQLRMAA